MVEYTDPNPFKPFHIGHLMTNAIGESIARIIEANGATVIRANYQGDVGLHVAKAIYGMLKEGGPDGLLPVSNQAEIIGMRYSWGSNEYDTNEEAKKEIDTINKKIYEKSDSEINILYEHGRKVTLEAFEEIYALLGTKFVHYFFESEMAVVGTKIVREYTGKVFEESDGAVIFRAEKHDPKLHTRVFINSQGLPTYETKEIGLTVTKFEKENPDLSIIMTAIEQGEYMKVVTKAIEMINTSYSSRMKHITHGMMRLTSGKMSSRKGNIITGESLIRDSIALVAEKVVEREMSQQEKKEIAEIVGISALKYSILKSSAGSDIIYDQEKSISFEGDSGPYLQYTAVRAQSIIAKAGDEVIENVQPTEEYTSTRLEKLLYRFEEVVVHAKEEFQPHYIATYLTELASEFNSFYANTKILIDDNPYKHYHLVLVSAFYITMKNGLHLLGIQTPEKM
jgi:arginyl-tRNA synthetase